MADIYGRNVSTLKGAFTAENASVTFANGLVALVQRMNFSYMQAITRLYDIVGNFVYYIGGRTQGQMGVDRVIGPSASIQTFYATYGNVCSPSAITINIQDPDCYHGAGAIGGANISYDLANCVITQVSIGVQAQDMIISENCTLIFTAASLAQS